MYCTGNEWLLKSTDFCNKVHTLPIMHVYFATCVPSYITI